MLRVHNRFFITEKPLAPENLKVDKVHLDFIELSWDESMHSKVYDVSNYTVQYKQASLIEEFVNGETVSAYRLQSTLRGLKSGTSYLVRIVSGNEFGRGEGRAITVKTSSGELFCLFSSFGSGKDFDGDGVTVVVDDFAGYSWKPYVIYHITLYDII